MEETISFAESLGEGDQVKPRKRFRYLEPTICSGLLDDPILYLHVRPLGEALLFDCGQIHHLAKRVLKSISAIFITHAHMDHFMGIDSFIRHNHVSPRSIDVFGPPGIAAKMAHKFSGYDWNLSEPFWCTFLVHEVHREKIASFIFPGSDGFACRPLDERGRADSIIYRNFYLRVEADDCDHRISSLMYRVTEEPTFSVDEARIAARGLQKGDWLRLLKKRFFTGDLAGPLEVLTAAGPSRIEDAGELYHFIAGSEAPAAIGYVTDVASTPENLGKIARLMSRVSVLVCECSFLKQDIEKARESRHLCTSDVRRIVGIVRPPFFVPIHLSKAYIGRSSELYPQLEFPTEVVVVRLPERMTPRPGLPEEFCRIPPREKSCKKKVWKT